MNQSAIPFNGGRVKYHSHGSKLYAARLVRFGQARYSKRMHRCRTATEAQSYAERWAARADRYFSTMAKMESADVQPSL